MRKVATGKVKIRAICGTYVVYLAFDMAETDCKGLMGFAIERLDIARGERVWLRGLKSFEATRPDDNLGELRSNEHPFQSFQWADYAVTPDKEYAYTVHAMYGEADALESRFKTTVKIKTEVEDDGKHAINFNRAAIASQEFARRFPNMSLAEAGEPAENWLARDLLSGLLKFIERAKNSDFSLHVAIYEISDAKPAAALREALDRGVNIEIVFHAKPGDTYTPGNIKQLKDHGLFGIAIGRENTSIMHNKFVVLSRKNKPVAVWTGSTNWSRNGFIGQLNVGHAVTDANLATEFKNYWDVLAQDPESKEMKDWSEQNNPMPPSKPFKDIEPMFSPARGSALMNWWKTLAGDLKPLFMTFPFGMAKDMQELFDKNDNILRFALLDKFGNGSSAAAAEVELTRIRKFRNIGLSVAPRSKTTLVHRFDGWQKEQSGIGNFVNWVHTKFMLVDPLGSKPITLTGSANWSTSSVETNDENMIAIMGDKRVADIYFCEFMRLFAHHRFRESVGWHVAAGNTAEDWKPQDLFVDWRKWVPDHFKAGSEKQIRRTYFIGN
jgi:phosphatidylserine/phosphatidylglycerophosphate/cardiolipin synthase-like enzyme